MPNSAGVLGRLLFCTSFLYFFVGECFVLFLALLSTDWRKTLGKNRYRFRVPRTEGSSTGVGGQRSEVGGRKSELQDKLDEWMMWFFNNLR